MSVQRDLVGRLVLPTGVDVKSVKMEHVDRAAELMLATRSVLLPVPPGRVHSYRPPLDKTAGAYVKMQYFVSGHMAGRSVILRVVPQSDLTPCEMLAMGQMLNHEVTGDLIAYILDQGLIRHFEEVDRVPVPAGSLTAGSLTEVPSEYLRGVQTTRARPRP